MNKDPLSKKEFKEIYSRVPRATVSLVVRTPNGIALALRSLPSWHGKWHLPGGSIFYKEKVRDAVKRKAKQELGIKIKIIKLLGYIEYPSEEKERGFGWAINLIFLCQYNGSKFSPNDEAERVEVFKKIPPNTISEEAQFFKKHWKEIRKV